MVVGVNCFVQENEDTFETLKVNPKIEKEQIKRLKAYKKDRKSKTIGSYCEKILNCAQGNKNLMPLIVEAVENKVTLGEISDSLRKVFGAYKERVTV